MGGFSHPMLRHNVALSDCTIGDSCIIHNGMCIVQDVLKAKAGSLVEIGANTCIDRGRFQFENGEDKLLLQSQGLK
ncbi:hypothetical protein LguiA_029257 [Lonicera macranthoides]